MNHQALQSKIRPSLKICSRVAVLTETGAVTGALLATGHARANEEQTLGLKSLGATVAVGEVRVAACSALSAELPLHGAGGR